MSVGDFGHRFIMVLYVLYIGVYHFFEEIRLDEKHIYCQSRDDET